MDRTDSEGIKLTGGTTRTTLCSPVNSNALSLTGFNVERRLNEYGARLAVTDFERGLVRLNG